MPKRGRTPSSCTPEFGVRPHISLERGTGQHVYRFNFGPRPVSGHLSLSVTGLARAAHVQLYDAFSLHGVDAAVGGVDVHAGAGELPRDDGYPPAAIGHVDGENVGRDHEHAPLADHVESL